MCAPKLLLLDEPSMGLAPRLVAQIFSIVSEINAQGTTILLVEQNAAQALRRAHCAYILATGEVVREGVAGDLAEDPAGPRRVPWRSRPKLRGGSYERRLGLPGMRPRLWDAAIRQFADQRRCK